MDVVHELAVLGRDAHRLGVQEGLALVKDIIEPFGQVAFGVHDAGEAVKMIENQPSNALDFLSRAVP